MTIEIRELVIQAQVTQSSTRTVLPVLNPHEKERLVDEITRQVLEQLREQQERTL